MARSITDPDRQARALADLARAAAGAGDLDRAEARWPRRRSPTRTSRRGRWRTWPRRWRGRVTWTGPRRWPRSITDPDRQARALADLAEAAAGAGDLDRARRWPGRPRRGPVDHRPGPAGAGAGGPGARRRRRRVTWTGPRRWPESITDPDQQAQALADLAEAAEARVTWTGPQALARSITDPDRRARALADLAQAAAGAGDLDRAAGSWPGRSPTRTGGRRRWLTWRRRRRGPVTWTGPGAGRAGRGSSPVDHRPGPAGAGAG